MSAGRAATRAAVAKSEAGHDRNCEQSVGAYAARRCLEPFEIDVDGQRLRRAFDQIRNLASTGIDDRGRRKTPRRRLR